MVLSTEKWFVYDYFLGFNLDIIVHKNSSPS